MLLPYIGTALIVLGLTKDQDETMYDHIAIVSGILFWTVFLIRVNM